MRIGGLPQMADHVFENTVVRVRKAVDRAWAAAQVGGAVVRPVSSRIDLDENDTIALLSAGPEEQELLFAIADETRRRFVGDSVHVRGIIEFSNYCVRNCLYCGLRRDNAKLTRYRLAVGEVVEVAARAIAAGYKTIVLQSGDDFHYRAEDIARMVEGVKRCDAAVAVTLSVGERSRREYAIMRNAGADRFLLKHETADPELYRRLHPGTSLEARLECLHDLRDLGFQVGSGSIVGLPGQTVHALAKDIALLRELDVEMAGIGPFIPHPQTPLADCSPGTLTLSLKVLAATRLALPLAHLPATTALATLHPDGRRAALFCGANVVMPNVTPLEFRRLYEIYPGSVALRAPDDGGIRELVESLSSLGRPVSDTCGHSPKSGSANQRKAPNIQQPCRNGEKGSEASAVGQKATETSRGSGQHSTRDDGVTHKSLEVIV